MVDPLIAYKYGPGNELLGPNRLTVPFVACGDVNGYDADQTYPLDANYVNLDPIQKPIDPPYRSYIEQRKHQAAHK
jgi:tRNA (cytidine32/guanosine34-2'-O)-methyltransferase